MTYGFPFREPPKDYTQRKKCTLQLATLVQLLIPRLCYKMRGGTTTTTTTKQRGRRMNSLLRMLDWWCCAPMPFVLKLGFSLYRGRGRLYHSLRGSSRGFSRTLRGTNNGRLVSQYRPYYWLYCVIQYKPYNWCTAGQVSCIGGNLPGHAYRVRHLSAYTPRRQIIAFFTHDSCLEFLHS